MAVQGGTIVIGVEKMSALVGIAAVVPLGHLGFVFLVDLPPALVLLRAAVPPPVAQHKHIILLITCAINQDLLPLPPCHFLLGHTGATASLKSGDIQCSNSNEFILFPFNPSFNMCMLRPKQG